MHIIQPTLFKFDEFLKLDHSDRLVLVLDTLNAEKLLRILEEEHWVGRKGYSVRGMWSALIAGVVYRYPSIADLVRQLNMNPGLSFICGFPAVDDIPSNETDTKQLKVLLEEAEENCPGIKIETVIADAGYDSKDNCKTVFTEL